MKLLLLALRMLRREWRAGELYALALALVVAVGGVTAVGLFTDRVNLALTLRAAELLGADLALVSDHALAPEFEREARRRGLRAVRAMAFPSMVVAGERSQLAEVKAVGPGYPLRGELRLVGGSNGGAPLPGTVWLEPALADKLGLAPRGTMELGSATLKVAGLIAQEPDRGGNFFNIAPRLMANVADMERTDLVQAASRINYRLMIAGDAGRVEAYRLWAEHRLGRGEKLEGVRDARPEVRAALERAGRFLGLAAMTSVILAVAAIVLSTRRFLERHLDGCAVMRCLGARQNALFLIYFYQFLALGLGASLAGCALGYGAQHLLALQVGSLVARDLPPPSWWPVSYGVATGLATLLSFALPFLLRLRRVPTLWVLRREIGVEKVGLTGFSLGFTLLAGLMLLQAGELTLGLYVIGGLLGALTVALVLAHGMIWGLGRLRRRVGMTWRYGLANIARRRHASAGQVVALGLGLTALLLLTVVRGDLLESWQTTLPADAPNRFVINIQADQLNALKAFFVGRRLAAPALYPMVRGRLVAVNGRAVAAADYPDERARRLVEREFNLSWADRLRADNQVVAGRWWGEEGRGSAQLSVEDGIAKTLKLRLGDRLTYQVAGQSFTARITSLRKVDWDSFRANFFVIAPPGLLEAYPVSYITAFYLPPQDDGLLNEMVRAFPNFTVIDVAAVMGQVRSIMERVTGAVELVFLFTLAAGVMALYAAIAATREERVFEAAVMRTLGASRRQLTRAQLAEFAGIGLLAGLTAAVGATALGYVLASRIFHLPYQFSPVLWVAAVACGVGGVALAGWLGTRGVLRQPPLITLRGLG